METLWTFPGLLRWEMAVISRQVNHGQQREWQVAPRDHEKNTLSPCVKQMFFAAYCGVLWILRGGE